MQQTIAKSFKDLFSGIVLVFMAKTTLLSLVVTMAVVWLVNDLLVTFVKRYLAWIPWEWVQTSGAAVAAIAIAYMIFVLIHAIVTSLLIEPLLIKMAQKHYPEHPVVGSPNMTASLLISLKSGIIFLSLFLLTLPLMFIPLVGALWMLWLWSILLKAPTFYDVSTLFLSDKTAISAKKRRSTLLAMVAAGFNYIPLLNIFAPVFAQILFMHHILGRE